MESLEWVTQTMTTVGYGQDAPWSSDWMFLLAIVTQLAGITLVFMSIPIVVTPWIKQRLSIRPDTEYTGPGDHIIIAEYTSIVGSLIDELEQRGIPYVLIESDEETATNLYRDGYEVIIGNAVDYETLQKAGLIDSRLVILDCPDDRNASIALTVQECDKEISVVVVAEEQSRAIHMEAAGIDKIIYPKENIGEVLARKALSGLGRKNLLEEQFELELAVREFPVLGGSPLINTQLKNSDIREEIGIRIIGVWREGNFLHNPSADFRIKSNDILVASGSPESLDDLHDITEVRELSTDQNNVLIIGYGKEGTKAHEVLKEHNTDAILLDIFDREGVDYVGDGSDPEVLQEVGIENVATVIIAVSDDDMAILITLMVKDLNPRAEILVQVNNEASLEPIYRAGASYVLSLEKLTSQMLASSALKEDILFEELNLKVRRCGPGDLVEETPRSAKIGKKYYVTVVGVERNGELRTEIGPDYTFQNEDVLYLAGNSEQVQEFTDSFNVEDIKE